MSNTKPKEVPMEVKLEIIEQEANNWRAHMYRLEVRHKVNQRLNSPRETMQAIEDEMVNCEMAIELLEKEGKAIAVATPKDGVQ